jgi:hypothetical protein
VCVTAVLAVLIGLVQVAGPWLCCCPSARAVAPKPPAPADVCPLCHGCPPADDAPQPAVPPPCPCGGKAVEAVLPAKAEPVAEAPDQPSGAAVEPARVDGHPSPCMAAQSPLPFLPPGTRLFVHHVLRC